MMHPWRYSFVGDLYHAQFSFGVIRTDDIEESEYFRKSNYLHYFKDILFDIENEYTYSEDTRLRNLYKIINNSRWMGDYRFAACSGTGADAVPWVGSPVILKKMKFHKIHGVNYEESIYTYIDNQFNIIESTLRQDYRGEKIPQDFQNMYSSEIYNANLNKKYTLDYCMWTHGNILEILIDEL